MACYPIIIYAIIQCPNNLLLLSKLPFYILNKKRGMWRMIIFTRFSLSFSITWWLSAFYRRKFLGAFQSRSCIQCMVYGKANVSAVDVESTTNFSSFSFQITVIHIIVDLRLASILILLFCNNIILTKKWENVIKLDNADFRTFCWLSFWFHSHQLRIAKYEPEN